MTEVVRDFTHVLNGKESVVVTWSGLDGDDSGKAVDLSGYSDKTVHVFGTFDSGTLTLYGSNDPRVLTDRAAGTLFGSKTASWIIAQDSLGNNIAKSSSDGGDVIIDNYKYYLPVVASGGGSCSLTCIIKASRAPR